MSESIDHIKNVGAKKELLCACNDALWQVKRCCDEASKDAYREARMQISEAKRYLKLAEECCEAAQKIEVEL